MQTRFAKVGEAHVAYRVFEDGPVDILYFLGEYIPIDAMDEEPRYARALRRLSSLGRVIAFNRRGVGLSDAPDGPLTHEQNVEDALAVLDHIGSERAVIFGANLVSGAAAMCFAAQHSPRTAALVLVNTTARTVEAPDYPIGIPADVVNAMGEQTRSLGPTEEFDFLRVFAPSVASDDRFRDWWDRAGHRGASPARAQELWKLVMETDVRHVLPSIKAPTLVISRTGLAALNLHLQRFVADNIAGARYAEVPGGDMMWWIGDDGLLDQIEMFLSGTGSVVQRRRRLATVLFFDIVASTEHAVQLGDMRWRELLATYHDLSQREIARFGGRIVGTAGDGVTATFDMPADAVRCAQGITERVTATLGIEIRSGLHTGEIEVVGEDVAGIGVHIAARVMSAARSGEVLVSRTVADLVTGSGIEFEDRGEHELKGVPGRWHLHALKA